MDKKETKKKKNGYKKGNQFFFLLLFLFFLINRLYFPNWDIPYHNYDLSGNLDQNKDN